MFFFGLALLGLMACSGGDDRVQSKPVSQAHEHRTDGNTDGDVNGTVEPPESFDDEYYSGRILGSPQEEFQYGVDNLVSSFMDPVSEEAGLGYVSGVQGDDTGVWFNGYLKVNGGFNEKTGGQKSFVQGASFINVLIWDEHAGLEAKEGGLIPGIKIGPARLVSGKIQGHNVEVEFSYRDKNGYLLGYLALVGSYNTEIFSGTFHFDNEFFSDSKYNDGGYGCDGKGACGQMGSFSIPTCQIFDCR